jgi:protein associated with RNAse G/E
MDAFSPFMIKSLKHDGRLHRMWHENWRVPASLLHPDHSGEALMVFINAQTRIQEADGKEWISRIPAVSFFIPNCWYNIVALIEESGIQYYCNLASPPDVLGHVITYIDYDLDVMLYPNGTTELLDEDEYEQHKQKYHYSPEVEAKVDEGLKLLLKRIEQGAVPFRDELVLHYYRSWEAQSSYRA